MSGASRGAEPIGVCVLGMHRSGTSAATRVINLLGPATCSPEDLIRDMPWNPSGHWESRSLSQLNDDLLRQMNRTWWYPPPSGPEYWHVAGRVTADAGDLREAFERTHRSVPWVWKDPRLSVLLPLWRRAFPGPVAGVVVVRNPLDVALSLHRRNGFAMSTGVALWERYNRLILDHSGGMPLLFVRYDDLVADPVWRSEEVRLYLADLGIPVTGALDPQRAHDFVDPNLRHSAHGHSDTHYLTASAHAVYGALDDCMGATRSFVPPQVPPEPPGVEAELASLGPHQQPAWNSPRGRDHGDPASMNADPTALPPGLELRHGAFPGVLDDLDPDSASLIVADPPWNSQAAWADLSPFASRVLKPGGILVAYIGNRHCFEASDRLGDYLNRVRLAFLPAPHQNPWDPEAKCLEGGSFILILSKGAFDPPGWWRNVVDAPVDRRWHEFERPLANVSHYVEAFSRPGDLVVDPFLGGGTTAVACARLSRRFVGCDVDPRCVEASRARLAALATGAQDS